MICGAGAFGRALARRQSHALSAAAVEGVVLVGPPLNFGAAAYTLTRGVGPACNRPAGRAVLEADTPEMTCTRVVFVLPSPAAEAKPVPPTNNAANNTNRISPNVEILVI